MMLIHPMRFPAHLMKISFLLTHRNTARASHHEGFIQNVHTDIRQDQDTRILPWLCVHFWAETCRIECDHREAECELRCECKGFHRKIVAKIRAEIERWTEIGERVAVPQHKLCKKINKLSNFYPQVKSQKRSMASQNQKHHNEEEKRKNKTRVSFNPLSSVGRCENSID